MQILFDDVYELDRNFLSKNSPCKMNQKMLVFFFDKRNLF